MNKPVRSALHCRAGSLIPPEGVADFHIGDMVPVWKPAPTHSEGGISDPALQFANHA